jgi:hypothetical protein
LEPATAPEECEKREEGDDLAADTQDDEHRRAVNPRDHPDEVLTEDQVINVSGCKAQVASPDRHRDRIRGRWAD